ncbi:leucyl/phenylalanyl-tRNA--protein transferase [Pseudoxanthomonas taiwanensis]|uniref:Leucyl/phenylalanyl-tRNA--protein transferase n=1 Tax=Pseudoxanthomonas taiwanensis TaxID=176598 RepID=A0A921TGJ1_9GAMM|nr:leucyl/phenylalanyl-tRNA--protein transferase [Pseudoxanthomonas taiwanensis]KAF1689974.1 leucyl/phenylalanyl-tRNA--protein transferase [Pseudoxanthomonas taiwanensis]
MAARPRLPYLLGDDPEAPFPPPGHALDAPDGLLAIGGDLSPPRLLNAYRQGIFPWYSDGQPILWWSPDPRAVFRTDRVHLSSRFRRGLRRSPWVVTADTAFDAVVAACASVPRRGQDGTWITAAMRQAYGRLHRLGHAHSVEVWDGTELAGGLYGVAVGRMFFGESMFSARSGGSKVALGALAAWLHRQGWPLLDAQVENPHLVTLGVERWPRPAFLEAVAALVRGPGIPGPWTQAFDRQPAASLAG